MISVLVVDDSVVVRRLITDALGEDPGIHVVGTAANGKLALAKIGQLQPDLVTLDIEMPVMDGLETLRAIRATQPRLPVIMFSTLTAAGASATLDALAAGASDYVTKPANVGSITESIRSVREQIIPRIHALCAHRTGRPASAGFGAPGLAPARPGNSPLPGLTAPMPMPVRASATLAPPNPLGPPVPPSRAVRSTEPLHPGVRPGSPLPARGALSPATGHRTDRVDIVAVGSSTGGPDALARVVRSLPADLGVPVVVVQHMPPVFTKMFADRLDRTSALHVVEAESDMPLRPGCMYIAPGDLHMEVARRGTDILTRLHAGAPENFCRPAVDVLFRSVAQTYGGAVLAVVLTGMGQDGKRGAEQLRANGAEIVAQDEASSVVWGMPGAVVNAGLASAVLPLDDVARHVVTRVSAGRGVRPVEVSR